MKGRHAVAKNFLRSRLECTTLKLESETVHTRARVWVRVGGDMRNAVEVTHKRPERKRTAVTRASGCSWAETPDAGEEGVSEPGVAEDRSRCSISACCASMSVCCSRIALFSRRMSASCSPTLRNVVVPDAVTTIRGTRVRPLYGALASSRRGNVRRCASRSDNVPANL
jgi:hypothetical protein